MRIGPTSLKAKARWRVREKKTRQIKRKGIEFFMVGTIDKSQFKMGEKSLGEEKGNAINGRKKGEEDGCW